jgi:MFS family permease
MTDNLPTQVEELPAPLPKTRGLMRDRDFLKMFVSEGSAGIGSQVSLLALPLTAIVLLHASALEVGTLSALGTIPYLLFGLPVGVWLERSRRRPVLLYSALGRAAVLVVVPVLWALGRLDVEILYGVAFLVGLMTTFYDIAWQAYLPSLVGTSRLHEASARLSLCDSGSQLVGPGLAGFLIRAFSAPLALLVDALGFVVAGLSVKRISRSEPAVTALDDGLTVREQVAEGLRYVAGHYLLRWTAVYVGATNAVGAALNVVLVLFAARVLHFSAGTIGAVFLLGNLGFVLGAPLVRRVTARLGIGRTMLAGALVGGAAPVFFPLARPADAVAVLVAGLFLRAVASPFYGVNQVSLRLAITPAPLLARMTATMKFFVMGAMPLGSFLGGALAGSLGSRSTLWLIAAVSALSVLAVAATKLREVSTPPEELRPEAVVALSAT